MKPSESAGRPLTRRPRITGSATIRSAWIQSPDGCSKTVPFDGTSGTKPQRTSTPAPSRSAFTSALAIAQHERVKVGEDFGHRLVDQLAFEVTRELGKRENARGAHCEGIADRHRAVDEVGAGLDERDANAVACEVAQGHDRFQAGDAA